MDPFWVPNSPVTFLFLNFYSCAEFQKNLMGKFRKNLVTWNGHKDMQMYGQDKFPGLPLKGIQDTVINKFWAKAKKPFW